MLGNFLQSSATIYLRAFFSFMTLFPVTIQNGEKCWGHLEAEDSIDCLQQRLSTRTRMRSCL
jgi:hypothetical protein